MIFNCFIIPANVVAQVRRRIDLSNIVEPILIQEGVEAGNYYLDLDILNRITELQEILGVGKRPPNIPIKQLDTDLIFKKI